MGEKLRESRGIDLKKKSSWKTRRGEEKDEEYAV